MDELERDMRDSIRECFAHGCEFQDVIETALDVARQHIAAEREACAKSIEDYLALEICENCAETCADTIRNGPWFNRPPRTAPR